MNTVTSVTASPKRTPSMHFFNLIRDTRPNEFVWSEVQKLFWRLHKHQILSESRHDLGTFDFGIGFRAVFSLRTIRGIAWLIVTLTPYDRNDSHTNLTIWQPFMTYAKFLSVKGGDQS